VSGHSQQEQAEREPGALMAEHHGMALWVQVPLLVLGAWLIGSPVALGYGSQPLARSDAVSGVLVIVLAALSFDSRRAWAPWLTCVVGIWLTFAPLVVWAPTAAEYANDVLVGSLIIGLSILVPHSMEMPGPDVPPGWSYNPSTWLQRAPIIVLGLVSFLIARYMAAFQLGHIPSAWDPIFGSGTERILTSDVSRAWPVSDAGLGAAIYLFEVLMGLMGDPRRWRTMPWMVTFFGIAVVPLGITSIVLVILQPLAVGTFCTLCLGTAVFMLTMVPLSLDEVVAMGQFLALAHRSGMGFWHTFWMGGNLPPDVSPGTASRPSNTAEPAAMVWGVTLPWPLALGALLGVWVMFAPLFLGTSGVAASSNYLVGRSLRPWR
jgi:uncharacterized membrane protein